MISEFLIGIVFNIVEGALSILPNWNFDVNASFLTTGFDLIRVAFYLLPMTTIISILTIVVTLNTFKIVISILKTIWEILPLV